MDVGFVELFKNGVKSLIDYGTLGIVLAVFLSPVAYIFWQLGRQFVTYTPTIFIRIIAFLDNAIATQGATAQAVKENTIATAQIAVLVNGNTKQLTDIHAASEIEETALLALRSWEIAFVEREPDAVVKSQLRSLSEQMADILQRKLTGVR